MLVHCRLLDRAIMFSTYSYNDVLYFNFENIYLPDSTSNEPESHGYVRFKIRTLNDPSIGEEIENTSYIYFDNNPPIKTNSTYHIYGVSKYEINENLYSCIGDSILHNGAYWHASFTEVDSLIASTGVDSIVVLNAFFYDTLYVEYNYQICNGDSMAN